MTNPKVRSIAVQADEFLERDVAVSDKIVWWQCRIVEDGETNHSCVLHLVDESFVPYRVEGLLFGARTIYVVFVDVHLDVWVEYRLVLPEFPLLICSS